MEGVQGQHGQDDHDALEDDEVPLVLDQLALPPLGQLDDPVDAADEDAHRRQRQGGQESLEFGRGPEAGVPDVLGGGGIAHGADGEIDTDEDEDGEGENLEG